MADQTLSAKALAGVFKGLIFTNHLSNYLSARDIRSFGQALNLPTTGIIHRRTLQIIHQRLLMIFEETDKLSEIKAIMQSTGACIAGSFVTSSVLNEDWGGDIDFFCPATKEDFTDESYDFKRNHIGNKIYDDAPVTPLEMHLRKTFDYQVTDYEHYAGCSDSIKVVRTYRDGYHGTTPLQAILVNTRKNTLHDWIFRNFDFSICKAIYYVDRQGRDRLKFANLDEIIDKHCSFEYTNRLLTSITRYHKYTARGFTISKDTLNLKYIVMTHPEVRLMYPLVTEYLTKYKVPLKGSRELSIRCEYKDCPATFCELPHFHYYGPLSDRIYLSLEANPIGID